MRGLGSWVVGVVVMLGGAASPAAQGPLGPEEAAGRGARALADKIDARLAARWAEAKVRPAAVADDGEFLRRASLDLVGRIPTAAEARDFLDDPDTSKRAVLVDRLLESPAYAARAAVLWRRLLLPESEDAVGVNAAGLEAWLRKKVGEVAGYDRIVREVLVARLGDEATDGDAVAAASVEVAPVAFYTARAGKPEALAGDAARAFLGIRVECAQCHDHPFARWKRPDFWSFAAFFAGVPGAQADANGAMRRNRDDVARRELMIPGTKTVVKATALDGANLEWRPRASTRQVLAEWLTAPGNPYFARAAVNRTWARLFGLGLIDPVDDLDAEGDPALVALLDEVAADFRGHAYDVKYLLRALMATRAYNLTSAAPGDSSAGTLLFSRMPVRGLSPTQLIDSLAQATGVDPGEARGRFLEMFADRDATPTEPQTSILQALTLMNGAYLDGATKPETGDVIGAIAEAPYLDTAGRVEMAYLAALTRRPRPEEAAIAARYIDRREGSAAKARALSDVFWALLNGSEFRTNH